MRISNKEYRLLNEEYAFPRWSVGTSVYVIPAKAGIQ